jgi:hypothetical protein
MLIFFIFVINKMVKLKQQDFYCVACRSKVTAHKNDMGVQSFRNKKAKGGTTPTLRSVCQHCGYNLTKFISPKNKKEMSIKYGKF